MFKIMEGLLQPLLDINVEQIRQKDKQIVRAITKENMSKNKEELLQLLLDVNAGQSRQEREDREITNEQIRQKDRQRERLLQSLLDMNAK